MKCYRCGATLTQHDFCTACKCDVRQYKLIIEASNRKYNEGLEKAQIRDLTGAVTALKQSLKLNKEHVDARNLLGLIYFEMGEVVSALGEWIISKNLQPNKNIASDYISRLQNNQSRLDTYNQAIHKYNTALDLCHQGSDDLAIIQLKKIVSLNPNHIKSNLLLALLYMEQEHWDKAYPILKRVTHIDHGNTQAQRYLREITRMTKQKSNKAKPKTKDSVVRYERDNEIIIQPAEVIEPNTGKGTLLGFVIGFLLGMAIIFFLIMPGRLQDVRSELEENIRIANENREAQSATIASLESRLADLTEERDAIVAQYGDIYGEDSNAEAVNALLSAVATYLADAKDIAGVQPHMDICVKNEAFFEKNTNSILGLYDSMKALTSPSLAQYHYDLGYAAYETQEYDTAVSELELAVMYYSENADSLFYLASSYQAEKKLDKAKEVYGIVIERFPNTTRASQAKRALDSMQ